MTRARAPALGRRTWLRVLMTTDAVGGVWRYSIDLGRALTARGVSVSLAAMGPAPSRAQLAEAHAAGMWLVHRPFQLEWMDEPWSSVRAAGDWLLAVERGVKPDVVHLNGYAHAALPWPVPVVVVAHSCVRTWWSAVKHEPAPARLRHYTEVVATGLNAASAVVAPSAAMLASVVAEYDTLCQRAHVIPNGCEAQPAAADAKTAIVLTAGRAWDEAKNLAALARIAHRLTWPVYLAGETASPDGARSAFKGVHALGVLPHAAMRRWYDRASIYVLPARYEPFGLSVLEAARAGCALVLGDIESLRENWHGAASFVAPDDTAALGAAIQSLIDDDKGRAELASRARRRAADLTIERTADEYVLLYESLRA